MGHNEAAMRETRTHLLLSLIAGIGLITIGLGTREGTLRASLNDTSMDPGRELHQLFTAEWDYEMQRDPLRASSLGDRRWNDRWPDLSLPAIQEDHEHRIAVLARLKAIDRSGLSPADQLNYDIFEREYEKDVEGYAFHWFLIPLNQREGIQTSDTFADELRFETRKDYEDWIARLQAFPAYMDQTIALMTEGIRERMMLPRVVMQRVPTQIDKQIVTDPEPSPYYRPFKSFAAGIGESDRTRLASLARDAITSDVIPAFARCCPEFCDGVRCTADESRISTQDHCCQT